MKKIVPPEVTTAEVATKNLPWPKRSSTVEASFRAKLAILRKRKKILVRNPRSEVWRPRTLGEFRSWQEEGKFRAWTSKSIDAPGGSYPELAKELADLLEFFNRDPIDKLERLNSELKEQNRVQAIQIVEMESIIRSLIDELVIAGGPPISKRSTVVALYRKY